MLVGPFTPVNGQNQTAGPREAYRFCLVLGDLKTGKVVAKGVARSQLAGVDTTPTTVFRESPVWTADPATQAYISTCQDTSAPRMRPLRSHRASRASRITCHTMNGSTNWAT